MGLGLITALAIASIVASLAASSYSSSKNYQAQVDTNETNKELQAMTNSQNLEIARETNAANIEMTKNRHQWEVQDLVKAGLNPVLSAGGQGAPMATLNTPQMQAAKMQAPYLDTSGIQSALSSVTSMAMMMAMMSNQQSIAAENRELRSQLDARYDGLRSAKTNYYNAKTQSLARAGTSAQGQRAVSSAKQLSKAAKAVKRGLERHRSLSKAHRAGTGMSWDQIIKELNS